MGFTELLTIMFVVLKLVGIIDWNWFFVLLPEIIAFVFYIVLFILGIYGQSKAISNIFRYFDNDDF